MSTITARTIDASSVSYEVWEQNLHTLEERRWSSDAVTKEETAFEFAAESNNDERLRAAAELREIGTRYFVVRATTVFEEIHQAV